MSQNRRIALQRCQLSASCRETERSVKLPSIPNTLHFIWFGAELPEFAAMMIHAAAVRCPTATVRVWVEPGRPCGAAVEQLCRNDQVEFCPFVFDDELTHLYGVNSPMLDSLRAAWSRLTQRAAQANVARLLTLANYGGIYLDTDVLVVKDFAPLREHDAFCGLESVVWPRRKLRRWGPYRLLVGPALSTLRHSVSRVPGGYRANAWLERRLQLAANNAVFGARAKHPLLLRGLSTIASMSPAEQVTRFRLGTHLLQDLLAEDPAGCRSLAPTHFYPLGPVMSHQYFLAHRDPGRVLAQITSRDTYAIHLYASVCDLNGCGFDYIAERGRSTLYGALCQGLLPPTSTAPQDSTKDNDQGRAPRASSAA